MDALLATTILLPRIGGNVASSVPSAPRPWLAALLSLLAPGLGHVHAGRAGQGLLAYGAAVGFILAGANWTGATYAGLVLTAGLLGLWALGAAAHAWQLAARAQGRPGPWFSRRRFCVPLALGACAALAWGTPAGRYRALKVQSVSMVPALPPGARIIEDASHYRAEPVRRADLVLYRSPSGPGVSRCVAVAGDWVEVRDGRFLVNGAALPLASRLRRGEPGPVRRYGPLQVPPGTIFCLGDNWENTYDSRFWGPMALEAVQGKLLYAYWLPRPGNIRH